MFQGVRARLRLYRRTRRRKKRLDAIDAHLRLVEQTHGEEEAFRQQVRGVFTGNDPRAMLVPGDAVFVLHRQVPWR